MKPQKKLLENTFTIKSFTKSLAFVFLILSHWIFIFPSKVPSKVLNLFLVYEIF